MESSKVILMRTKKFRKSALIVKGLYRYKVTNLPDFQKWPPLGMTPVCFLSPSLISPWVCEESAEGGEASEIDLSFQESLHIKWLSGNQNWMQIAFEDPDQHIHAENLLFFIGWFRNHSRLQSNSAHKIVIAAGGRDHD